MNDHNVSTIIPAYRAANTIGRAVESVLAQTRPPAEVIVVDDGSPDDLAGAVRPFQDRIRLVKQANGGAASARNRGIDVARGSLLAFLDADDYWHPHKLERQLEVFTRHPQVGLVAGTYLEQTPGQPPSAPVTKACHLYDSVLSPRGRLAFEIAMRVWTGTVLVKRERLATHRFQSGLEPAEDRDLWVRLVESGPVYLLSEPLATAVLEAGSLSRSNIDRDCSNMLRVVRGNGTVLGRTGLRHWEAKVLRRWASGHLAGGNPRAAMLPAWGRLSRQPWSPEAWWIALKSAVRTVTAPALLNHTSPVARGLEAGSQVVVE